MICGGRYPWTVMKVADVQRLYTIGDVHLLNKNCWLKGFRADIQRVKEDPHARAILMGDLADYIGTADKRWDPLSIDPEISIDALADWGRYGAEFVRDEFRPIAGKIIGALGGNHEKGYETRYAQQLHSWVCTELGIPNLGYCCFIDIVFRKGVALMKDGRHRASRAYRIFAHHGAGAAQTPGGKINRLVRFMTANEADLYLVGHLHEQDVKPLEVLACNRTCTHIQHRRKLGLFTGSYLRSYAPGPHAGYAEQRGYAPVPLGCSCVEFRPFTQSWKWRDRSVEVKVGL